MAYNLRDSRELLSHPSLFLRITHFMAYNLTQVTYILPSTHLWCMCWPVSNSTRLQCPRLPAPPSSPGGQGTPLPSGGRQSIYLLTKDQKGEGGGTGREHNGRQPCVVQLDKQTLKGPAWSHSDCSPLKYRQAVMWTKYCTYIYNFRCSVEDE